MAEAISLNCIKKKRLEIDIIGEHAFKLGNEHNGCLLCEYELACFLSLEFPNAES